MMAAMELSATKELTRVTRIRSYNSNAEPVLKMLRDERFTGKVTINMSQGTVSVVDVEESSRLDSVG